jgi:hypothetical protein
MMFVISLKSEPIKPNFSPSRPLRKIFKLILSIAFGIDQHHQDRGQRDGFVTRGGRDGGVPTPAVPAT